MQLLRFERLLFAICCESFKDHVIMCGRSKRKDCKINTSLFCKNSVGVNIWTFVSKLPSMNNKKGAHLRDKTLFSTVPVSINYTAVKSNQVYSLRRSFPVYF